MNDESSFAWTWREGQKLSTGVKPDGGGGGSGAVSEENEDEDEDEGKSDDRMWIYSFRQCDAPRRVIKTHDGDGFIIASIIMIYK